jgi:YHS domain-containing protein
LVRTETNVTKYLPAILLVILGACSSSEPPAGSAETTAAPVAPAAKQVSAPVLYTRIIDPSTVCMVNDRYMGSAQIPVVVEGRTYYGCCKMCEKRLNEEASVRKASDPISHKEVDKALAVLAKDNSGAVFYFADEASLASANQQL